MAKEELKNLYEKISAPNVKRRYYSDSVDYEAIIECFKNVKGQDGPDGVILIGNIVYMIEHFQISIYLDGKNDKLQRALNATDIEKLGDKVNLFDEQVEWESRLLSNWLSGFSRLLDNHLSHYPEYEKNAHSKHPGKLSKFILVVEDNSNSIISDEGLCILDIQEFVEKILSYNEIDGIIVFDSSMRGNLVVAKDRDRLEADRNSGKLRNILSCDILMLIKKIDINGLTPEERVFLIDRISHFLCNLKESMTLEESIKIDKK